MDPNTCAACECELEAEANTITLGGQTVEVCCAECANLLGEAQAAIVGREA